METARTPERQSGGTGQRQIQTRENLNYAFNYVSHFPKLAATRYSVWRLVLGRPG